MTHGERVKVIRNSLGLTLQSFGRPLGVTKTAICNIEKGNRKLTDQMAKAICRQYNANYDYLMFVDGNMFHELSEAALDELCCHLDESDRSFIKTYITLPPNIRRSLRGNLNAFVESNGAI